MINDTVIKGNVMVMLWVDCLKWKTLNCSGGTHIVKYCPAQYTGKQYIKEYGPTDILCKVSQAFLPMFRSVMYVKIPLIVICRFFIHSNYFGS